MVKRQRRAPGIVESPGVLACVTRHSSVAARQHTGLGQEAGPATPMETRCHRCGAGSCVLACSLLGPAAGRALWELAPGCRNTSPETWTREILEAKMNRLYGPRQSWSFSGRRSRSFRDRDLPGLISPGRLRVTLPKRLSAIGPFLGCRSRSEWKVRKIRKIRLQRRRLGVCLARPEKSWLKATVHVPPCQPLRLPIHAGDQLVKGRGLSLLPCPQQAGDLAPRRGDVIP